MSHLWQNKLAKALLRFHELDKHNQTIFRWTGFLFTGSHRVEKVASCNCLWSSSATNGIKVLIPNASPVIPEQENVGLKLNEIKLEE